MIYGLCIIGIFIIFLAGYASGRRIGMKEGFKRGITYAPLEFKRKYFEKNVCPICSKNKFEKTNTNLKNCQN